MKCSFLTHTFIFQFVPDSWDKQGFYQFRQRGFICPVRLLCTTTLAPAAPRGYHFEIIIRIQFGFVNRDRALLDPDSWACLMWSSAFSRSVASLSFKLLSCNPPDRRASHSLLKGLIFFFLSLLARFLSEEKSTALCPLPNLLVAPPLLKQATGGHRLG